MRLRSIPPRTMKSVSQDRIPAGPIGPLGQPRPLRPTGSAGQSLPDVLDELRTRLADVRFGAGRSTLESRAPAHSSGPRRGPTGHPTGPHGRIFQKPARAKPAELVIPPRSSATGRPGHQIVDTPEARIITIEFPVPVAADEVRWEIHGDVLEVDHQGAAFPYFHAFLVPAGCDPEVSRDARHLTFRFPKPI